MSEARLLKDKIATRRARVGVIGLGYVGLPLAVEFASSGFSVLGLDCDEKRLRGLQKGVSPLSDVGSEILGNLIRSKKIILSDSHEKLKSCDAVLMCVPTPLNKVKDPDLSYVLAATREIRKVLRPGHLIILESTTYPGSTQEVVLPELAKNGWHVGSDFFLCYSPERIDPGNRSYPLREIPKVVGGITRQCGELGRLLYQQVIREVILVSSTQVAEMSKLLENTFRIVNIGLINELALVSSRLGINIWEAIEAARTKPFGFMPFYPGPGIGGHCIGIDPLYLAWKARLAGSEIRFVELASRINAGMPSYVVQRISSILNSLGKTVRGCEILLLGVSYKRDIGDIRESPALEVIDELTKLGARVRYHDPWVEELRETELLMRSVQLSKPLLSRQDLVVILTDHSQLDYPWILKHARVIFDTRNCLAPYSSPSSNSAKVIVL